MSDDADVYLSTRNQLRGIAESLIAGPQFRQSETVRLVVRPAGFAGTMLAVEVQGTDLVWSGGRTPLTGTLRTLGAAIGVDPGPPEGSYRVTDPLPLDQDLHVDAGAAETVSRSLYAGAAALVDVAPGEHPVLWPEHFDVAVTVGDGTYGVSPGDSYLARPYAYVVPSQSRTGEFWNAPFGAAAGLDMTMAETDLIAQIADFFERGRRHL